MKTGYRYKNGAGGRVVKPQCLYRC